MSDERRFVQTGWPGLRHRLFHLYFLLRRPMTLGVRGCIYDEAAKAVFLIRHTYVPGWQFPGGGVERGETSAEALARECEEEANVVLTSEPRLVSIHYNRNGSPRDHVAFYLITQFNLAKPKAPDWEIAEAGFFPLDTLPEDTTPATRRRLDELFKGAIPSPFW